MGILDRFSTIMRSNINSLLDKMEDPAKIIDQTLLDLRHDLADVKKETANVMADERGAKRRLDECRENITKYTTAAQNALRSGNEDDARKLIAKKQQFEANLASLQSTYELAHTNAEKMKQMHDKLTADIEALEARKDAAKGKIAAAKAQERMNDVIAGVGDSSASIAAFERMEGKADKMLDAAMAEADLNAGIAAEGDLLGKYSSGSPSSVDDELAAMKASLGL